MPFSIGRPIRQKSPTCLNAEIDPSFRHIKIMQILFNSTLFHPLHFSLLIAFALYFPYISSFDELKEKFRLLLCVSKYARKRRPLWNNLNFSRSIVSALEHSFTLLIRYSTGLLLSRARGFFLYPYTRIFVPLGDIQGQMLSQQIPRVLFMLNAVKYLSYLENSTSPFKGEIVLWHISSAGFSVTDCFIIPLYVDI